MASDTLSQFALANDPAFRRRFKGSLSKIAWQILNEGAGVTNHNARKAYALQVVANLDSYVNTLIGSFVMRTNLFSATTGVSLVDGVPKVTTTATDADVESQLATDWDFLAGAGA